ncbi:MAG: glycoside hydrolase [Verrucomicrobiales bacterium]|nr:glycoside hydrolase [Verrucomicrobiales bacterium]
MPARSAQILNSLLWSGDEIWSLLKPKAILLTKVDPAVWGLVSLLASLGSVSSSLAAEAELVEVKKIWDAAPHNAFTDLVRYRDEWFCVFREGAAHVSPDGALRVIVSRDGSKWNSAALLTSTNGDLRDAKITVMPNGRLMLSGAVALRQPAQFKHRSLAWFSDDGRAWSEPVVIGDPNMWLWRTTWREDTAYSIGYDTAAEGFVRLYTSKDGKQFNALVPLLFGEGKPNETSIIFDPDGTAYCLLRRDGQPGSGKLGVALTPYTQWEWKDLLVRIGGPHLVRLPDGRLVAAVRLYDGAARTSLCWVERGGKLTEFVKLPSGGDTSYAGLVWHEDLLWVSYYSSHEAKTSIYLAKIRLPRVRGN